MPRLSRLTRDWSTIARAALRRGPPRSGRFAYGDAMALRDLEGVVGAPWARPLAGALDQLVVESDALAGNPLGDPARRPLYVYRPPGVELDHPQGTADRVRDPGVHRAARHVAVPRGVRAEHDRARRRDVPPPGPAPMRSSCSSTPGPRAADRSSSTRASTGRYLDYLCDEVVAFIDERYPTLPARDHRGLAGKSSGGYGAMVVPMLRPDVFGALASHAGDALFECCYQHEFRDRGAGVARQLRRLLRGVLRAARGRRPLRLRHVRRPVRDVRVRVRVLPGPDGARAGPCCRSRSRPAA